LGKLHKRAARSRPPLVPRQRMEPQGSPRAQSEVGNPRVGFAWGTDSHGRMVSCRRLETAGVPQS
jgi:hypothetical protein